MPKQIDREKLIKFLNENYTGCTCAVCRLKLISTGRLIDEIESGKFDAPEATGWISVKDGPLPISSDLGDKFLILTKKKKIFVTEIFISPTTQLYIFFQFMDICEEDVTHWANLPPAPEKDDE